MRAFGEPSLTQYVTSVTNCHRGPGPRLNLPTHLKAGDVLSQAQGTGSFGAVCVSFLLCPQSANQSDLGKDRVYFLLQLIVHYKGNSQDLEAGADTEVMEKC